MGQEITRIFYHESRFLLSGYVLLLLLLCLLQQRSRTFPMERLKIMLKHDQSGPSGNNPEGLFYVLP